MNCNVNRIFLLSIGIATIISCETNRPSEGSKKAGEHIKDTVVACVETDPVPQKKNEDSADDPAIWVDTTNTGNSFVIGTDKKGGLATYDLDGKLLYYYAVGNMNNCDLRYGFKLGDKTIDVLASSNRSSHSLSLYQVKAGGVLIAVHARTIVSQMQDDVYGLCMYKSPLSEKFYVFMNSKAGEVEQWELFQSDKKIDARLVRSFKLNTQTEGMVADDEMAMLFIGEEVAGIHKIGAEPDAGNQVKPIPLSSEANKNIRYDIEGLAIYKTGPKNGYLLASSQGNYSYAIFERQGNNKYLGSFRIVNGDLDGVEETDGIDVTNVPLGSKFPKGMLVVQDGFNYDHKKLKSQNFKYIDWKEIENLLEK